MRLLQQAEDLTVRPSLRVAGAFLMLLVAYALFDNGLPLFEAEEILPEQCREGRIRRRAMCELGNFLLWLLPPSIQGEVEGTARLVGAMLFAYFAWLFFRPLVQRARKRRAL